jgi:hypothetical protein
LIRLSNSSSFKPDIDAEISTTVHHREFGPKKGERYEAQRRSPSDLWNREGTLDSVTTHADAYGQKLADRVAARRPADSDILKGSGAFDSETVNSREYQAKRGERFDPKRQEPSDLWKVFLSFCLVATTYVRNNSREKAKWKRQR